MEAKEILELMELEAEFRPVFKRGLEIIRSYGPDLNELVLNMSIAIAENKMAVIGKYEAAGFSREEAIMLVQDEWFAIARGAKAIGNGKKG